MMKGAEGYRYGFPFLKLCCRIQQNVMMQLRNAILDIFDIKKLSKKVERKFVSHSQKRLASDGKTKVSSYCTVQCFVFVTS